MIPDNDMANNIMRWMKTKLNGCKQFSGKISSRYEIEICFYSVLRIYTINQGNTDPW